MKANLGSGAPNQQKTLKTNYAQGNREGREWIEPQISPAQQKPGQPATARESPAVSASLGTALLLVPFGAWGNAFSSGSLQISPTLAEVRQYRC